MLKNIEEYPIQVTPCILKNIEEYPFQVTLYLLRSIARMDGGILSKSLPHPVLSWIKECNPELLFPFSNLMRKIIQKNCNLVIHLVLKNMFINHKKKSTANLYFRHSVHGHAPSDDRRKSNLEGFPGRPFHCNAMLLTILLQQVPESKTLMRYKLTTAIMKERIRLKLR